MIPFFLDRDGGRSSKLIPEEHERRRAIFWELLNMDCRMVSSSQSSTNLGLNVCMYSCGCLFDCFSILYAALLRHSPSIVPFFLFHALISFWTGFRPGALFLTKTKFAYFWTRGCIDSGLVIVSWPPTFDLACSRGCETTVVCRHRNFRTPRGDYL
jgi:hypothetical protein